MKKLIMYLLISASGSISLAADSTCKINLWSEAKKDKTLLSILAEKGYEPVYNDSADFTLNISVIGFAETGCDDGGIFGDKNFKRVNAAATITYKRELIDSIAGSDIQTESTTYNKPKVKRVSCATYEGALLNASSKIPSCGSLKEMLSEK